VDLVIDLLRSYWPTVAGLFGVLAASLAAAHAMLHKRDPKALAGWLGVILLAPVVGTTLYLLLGINRITRRASPLGRLQPAPQRDEAPPRKLLAALGEEDRHLEALVHFTNREMRRPMVGGNNVTPLANGDAAYPAMLAAIERATHSVTLCTYIFDVDEVGRAFVDALADAKERGVEVRVLIDAVGERYSLPRMAGSALKKRGVRVGRFLPTYVPWRFNYAQLRLHKKALVTDGRTAFTGGMNIRAGHVLRDNPPHPVRDLHFQLEGPIVRQLQDSFAEDWQFTTGEELTGDAFFPAVEDAGELFARAITDGPDKDLEHLKWAFMGGLACAQRNVKIVTPYFIPDGALMAALDTAAMRGVQVDIVLPEHCNLSLPQWASRATVWQLLQRGCRIWLTPAPFDHTKLMVVDDAWTLLGSGNWDPRSFRLCFELMVECHGRTLAAAAGALVDERLRSARELTLEEVEGRSLLVKLRDGAARVLSPYL